MPLANWPKKFYSRRIMGSSGTSEPTPSTVAADDAAAPDPIRTRLLEAAVKVFAAKGYAGARIMDIVREAGLSTGAVYGRFASKEALLREAVVDRTRGQLQAPAGAVRVADLIARGATRTSGPLADDDAVRLEAYVAARRVPEVAEAIGEASAKWRDAVQPLVDAALADGSVAADIDPEAVLYLVRTLHLGLLVQRAAGSPAPDDASWDALVHTIIDSFGSHATEPAKGNK